MKKSKKILAGVIAVCLMGGVTVIPESISPAVSMTASAEGEAEYTEGTYENLTYKNYGDYIEISDCDFFATEVVIPSEIESVPVTSIGMSAFDMCEKLKSINIPDSVKKIGVHAFSGCKSLTSIEIPNSVTFIGCGAFSNCISLTSITIPDSVTSIGTYAQGGFAFGGCTGLTSINVSENNEVYADSEGVLLNKDKTVLISYPPGKTKAEYTIPNSVTYIGYCSFVECKDLKSVTIPENVTIINSFAFYTDLKSITILNPECEISTDSFQGSCLTIYGYANSTAQAYAEKYGRNFVALYGEPNTSATLPESTMTGDANGDNEVTISDAVLIMQSISNPNEYKLSESAKSFADVVDKGDGLTGMDALAIQMVEAKLITTDEFPITSETLNSLIK